VVCYYRSSVQKRRLKPVPGLKAHTDMKTRFSSRVPSPTTMNRLKLQFQRGLDDEVNMFCALLLILYTPITFFTCNLCEQFDVKSCR